MNFANFLVATFIFVLQAAVQVQSQISWSGGYKGSINPTEILAAPKTSIFIQVPRKTSIFLRPTSSKPPAPISLPAWVTDGLVDESSTVFVPTRNTGSTCDDVPPDAEYSCEQQAQWGKCNEAWMIQGGFCAKVCGRCNSGVQLDDCNTVYEVLLGIPKLSIFVQAVQTAGFVDLFNNIDLEATVFAPTNAAFESLAQSLGATVEVVLDDINLPKVLMHNTIPGATLKKKDLGNGQILGTGEQGQSISIIINTSNGEVFQIQSDGPIANVVSQDIEACDAVVHIVDQVLLPNFDLIEN